MSTGAQPQRSDRAAQQVLRQSLVLAALVFYQGYAGAAPKPTKALGGKVVRTGEVMIVRGLEGGEPQLTDAAGKRYLLTGSWRKELLRLGGHVVTVWGQFGTEKLLQKTIKVERYEIIDSGGGRKPHVGRLALDRNKRLLLRQSVRSLEVSAKPALRALLVKRVGCKIWIVGELKSGVLKASKFGWLTCDVDTTLKPKEETPR